MAGAEHGKAGAKAGAARHQDRLRAALRENLKRRKAQARARLQSQAAGETHDSAGFEAEAVVDTAADPGKS